MQTDLLKQVQSTAKGGNPAADGRAGQAASKPDVAKLLAAGLRDLADKVEQQPELVSRAADLMSIDFMDSRAPPAEVLGVC